MTVQKLSLREQIAKERCYLCDSHSRDGCSKQVFPCPTATEHADRAFFHFREQVEQVRKENQYTSYNAYGYDQACQAVLDLLKPEPGKETQTSEQDLADGIAVVRLAEWLAMDNNETRLQFAKYMEEAQELFDLMYLIGFRNVGRKAR